MIEDRFIKILNNSKFKKYLKRNNESEKNRKYCRHDLTHFLDVARIAYIINLERVYGFKKDIIYAISLLHDIGKWKQYKDKIHHSITSASLAQEILAECGFEDNEIEIIKEAIIKHSKEVPEAETLNYLIYYADKKSRNCFTCKALNDCDWDEEKKNFKIFY